MAKLFQSIEPALREFIEKQHIFFNASAASDGRVNLSPRDAASLRVLDTRTVIYLDRTGSGNETAAHVRIKNRLTLMFCAFEGAPTILRLYGKARILRRGTLEYLTFLASAFDNAEPPGARQMVMLDVDSVQTSCGYGVPLFDYVGERTTLTRWAEAKGEAGLDEYRRLKNAQSIDGFATGLLENETI
ncbi:pyridoxamine 5'-phosphate oxidase family protein [Acidobacterium sp. S8]|uniref:pyridoxamine 5'-phosphate oxidase family protein n=1 Tax=Acidobacterium sp. S8 TaxID=1641854 RepID=UPI00131AECEC|nr:pyridoxamine 5'-phosphate oxidase family protein [Acidobacterium sp. S8]